MKFIVNANIFPDKSEAFFVGGCVRDFLLGRSPTDYDVSVSADPEEFAKNLAQKTSGHLVCIGKNDKRLFRVIIGDHIFDISPIFGGSIEADLKSRDFTINAMAYSLDSEKLIDPLGGQKIL